MNITNTTSSDIFYSDNSHIFGIPFWISEGYDAFGIEINRKDLCEWIEKVEFLELAGIDVHFNYIKEV